VKITGWHIVAALAVIWTVTVLVGSNAQANKS
jgi:hypothetical protein